MHRGCLRNALGNVVQFFLQNIVHLPTDRLRLSGETCVSLPFQKRLGPHPPASQPASQRPRPDVLLHETVVSWLRTFLRKRPYKPPGNMVAQREDFVAALEDFVAHANEKHKVASLCESFPARLERLVKKKGERLGH